MIWLMKNGDPNDSNNAYETYRQKGRQAGKKVDRQRNRVVSGCTGWCWWAGAVAEVRRGMVLVAGERYHTAVLFLERWRWWGAVITTHQISEQLATLCCHIYKFSRRVLVTAHKPHKPGGWALGEVSCRANTRSACSK